MGQEFAHLISRGLGDIGVDEISFAEKWEQSPPAEAGGQSLNSYITEASIASLFLVKAF